MLAHHFNKLPVNNRRWSCRPHPKVVGLPSAKSNTFMTMLQPFKPRLLCSSLHLATQLAAKLHQWRLALCYCHPLEGPTPGCMQQLKPKMQTPLTAILQRTLAARLCSARGLRLPSSTRPMSPACPSSPWPGAPSGRCTRLPARGVVWPPSSSESSHLAATGSFGNCVALSPQMIANMVLLSKPMAAMASMLHVFLPQMRGTGASSSTAARPERVLCRQP